MPNYNGKKVDPSTYTAGFAKKCGCTNPGDRTMRSNNMNIISTLKIDSVNYNGNAVLNANK